MNRKIILVRTPKSLVEKGLIGYGWKQVVFRDYQDSTILIENGFKANNINMGRKRKQIKLFHDIQEGDIIVVPIKKSIAIGIATDRKDYEATPDERYTNNRIIVEFFKDKNGETIYIPRTELENQFETRLRIRTSIASLQSFEVHINEILEDLNSGKTYDWQRMIEKKEDEAYELFIKDLSQRFQRGSRIGLKAGGDGLEELIEEIFIAKGYSTQIPAKNKKNSSSKIADVDIIATKNFEFADLDNEEIDKEENFGYLIQAKHHKKKTSEAGLNQLIAYDEEGYDNHKKVLITTAEVTDALREKAKTHNVMVIDGENFVRYLYNNIDFLSPESLRNLGISITPTLILDAI